MLKFAALIILTTFAVVVLAGVILCFILGIGSIDDGEHGYAVVFTVLVMIISAGWLAGGSGMTLKTLQKIELGSTGLPRSKDDIEMVPLAHKCPKCGRKDLMAITLGKDLGMVCCTSKICDDFGKAINLIPEVQ